MKKRLAMLLSVVMMVVALAACGTKTENADMQQSQLGGYEEGVLGGQTELNGVSYVMIYNPYIYDERDEVTGFEDPAALSTGDFGSQIVVGMNRAGDLGTDITVPTPWSQAEINADVDTTIANREGSKAGAMDPIYSFLDTQQFFHSDVTMQYTQKDTFQCLYAGQNCYIWSLNGSINEADATLFGLEFDNNIYQQDIQAFGQPRFTDKGGKVNLLFYPMQDGIGGYFTMADIYSSFEVPEDMANQYGFNTDHAIVHINSNFVTTNPGYAKSTMTHEFQHLICASNYFNFSLTPMMKTWLNESMSAYAEELIYPGIKEQGCYNQLYYFSDNFRKGQSLYNFDTQYDEYIGAYGAVYLFSEYMTQKSGLDIFSNVHSYWRNSYSATVTEAEALANSVTPQFYSEIDTKYVYSEQIRQGFETVEEEWMSKLTLDFYLETMKGELANLVGYEDQLRSLMLYSEIMPLQVEGGGRVLVAIQTDHYQIPADADQNLIYIGLDQNFEPVNLYTAQ